MSKTLTDTFVEAFKRLMPDSFVFAILLTLVCSVLAMMVVRASPFAVIEGWYKGFWGLLEFGMQMVLILVTGFAIALSPVVGKQIQQLAKHVNTPAKVYVFVVVAGTLLSMVSWGWAVIAAVLGRRLAEEVKGIDYRYLVAVVYLSGNGWVTGLSSSIPLVLNTDGNFLMKAGILTDKIPTSMTLLSPLNLSMIAFYLIVPAAVIYALRPKGEIVELDDLRTDSEKEDKMSIEEESKDLNLPFRALSDMLNDSRILSMIIVLMGGTYVVSYFWSNGLDLNLNIMIFTFLIFGMLLHQTPMRYVIAMKRACSNISGIVFQYPFYAGIMGIMIHTGLGAAIGGTMAASASVYTYPIYTYAAGGLVNFAIPSAGGEYAVLAPSVILAIKQMAVGMGPGAETAMIAKASLSLAYGETVTNLVQPFFFLIVAPVMCVGVKLQVRDIMGYIFIPFSIYVLIQLLMITFIPV
jgi:short-chain fatty acids transporter